MSKSREQKQQYFHTAVSVRIDFRTDTTVLSHHDNYMEGICHRFSCNNNERDRLDSLAGHPQACAAGFSMQSVLARASRIGSGKRGSDANGQTF
eukprot:6142705-Amphidinium_carterae.1